MPGAEKMAPGAAVPHPARAPASPVRARREDWTPGDFSLRLCVQKHVTRRQAPARGILPIYHLLLRYPPSPARERVARQRRVRDLDARRHLFGAALLNSAARPLALSISCVSSNSNFFTADD